MQIKCVQKCVVFAKPITAILQLFQTRVFKKTNSTHVAFSCVVVVMLRCLSMLCHANIS